MMMIEARLSQQVAVAQGALLEELTPNSENPETIPTQATKEPQMEKKS